MLHNNKHLYEIKHSQNFIKSPRFADIIVNEMYLKKSDFVIEIGPGSGSLTKSIIDRVSKFVGVELDYELFKSLKAKYAEYLFVEFFCDDFLKFRLPTKEVYKVVGNIPFALTSDIIRKILNAPNSSIDTHLILQKEAALRIVTKGYENFFALQYKPYFQFKIIKNISKFEFSPVPSIDAMLVRIEKRKQPLIDLTDRDSYTKFISFCFVNWKVNVKSALKKFFTLKQLGIISKEYGINLELRPSEITLNEWVVLFQSYKKLVSVEKKEVANEFAQRNLVKKLTKRGLRSGKPRYNSNKI